MKIWRLSYPENGERTLEWFSTKGDALAYQIELEQSHIKSSLREFSIEDATKKNFVVFLNMHADRAIN